MRHAIKRVVGYRTHNRSTPDRGSSLRPSPCPTDPVGARQPVSTPAAPTPGCGKGVCAEPDPTGSLEIAGEVACAEPSGIRLTSYEQVTETDASRPVRAAEQDQPTRAEAETTQSLDEVGERQNSVEPSLHSLAEYLPRARFFAGEDIEFTELADSSKQAVAGELVVYRIGIDDPVEVIADALARGAAGILTEQVLPAPLPQCIVPDTDRAIAEIAIQQKGHPHQKLILIGVTGSAGKTTTATCIAQVLADIPCRTAVVTDHACSDGVTTEVDSEPIPSGGRLIEKLHEAADAGAAVAVVELSDRPLQTGGYDQLDLDMLVVTGENQFRTDFGPSPVQCAIERVTSDGVLIVHSADQVTLRLARSGAATVLTYGTDERADVRVQSHELCDGVLTGLLRHQNRASLLESSLAGGHSSEALAAAAAVGIVTENSLPQIAESLSKVRSLPGRLQAIVPTGEAATEACSQIVLDIAGTPQRAERTLKHMRQQTRSRGRATTPTLPIRSPNAQAVTRSFPIAKPPRLWCVLAVTASDGPEALMHYGRLLETLADQCVLTCALEDKADFLRICHGVLDGVAECASMRLVADHRRAVRWAIQAAAPQDTILILGGIGKGSPTDLRSAVEAVQSWVQEPDTEYNVPGKSIDSAATFSHLKLFQPECDS